MTNFPPSGDRDKASVYELQLEASFDALAADSLRKKFDQIVESEYHVLLDFSRVTFIDSSGLGAIVFLFKRLRVFNKTLKIVNVQGQPLQLMQYLRIDKVIEITGAEGDDHE